MHISEEKKTFWFFPLVDTRKRPTGNNIWGFDGAIVSIATWLLVKKIPTHTFPNSSFSHKQQAGCCGQHL